MISLITTKHQCGVFEVIGWDRYEFKEKGAWLCVRYPRGNKLLTSHTLFTLEHSQELQLEIGSLVEIHKGMIGKILKPEKIQSPKKVLSNPLMKTRAKAPPKTQRIFPKS